MGAASQQVSVLLIVGLTVTGLDGCKKETDPKKAAYWVDRLDNKEQRPEAIDTLGRLGDKAAVPALVKHLDKFDKREDRSAALIALGRIGDKSAVPAVVKWLEKAGEWQPEAAYALGQLGDTSAIPKLLALINFDSAAATDARGRHAKRLNISITRALAMLHATDAAPSIKRLLNASDERVREAAVHALGDLADPTNTPTIVDAVLNDREAPLVRLAAIQSLGDMGDPAGVPALIQMLFVELGDISFYEPARYAIIRLGNPAVPELLKTLKRQNTAVESLKMADGTPVAEAAIEAKASSVLGTLRAPEAAEPMAAVLAKNYDRAKKMGASSPSYYAVIEIAYALGNIGGPRAVAALLPLAKDTDASFRIAACEALTAAGDHGIAPQLIAAAKTGDANARNAAVIAASRLGTGADLAAYDALGKAGDAKVPASIMGEMLTNERSRLLAAKECGSQTACWKKKLGDSDANVRERAVFELGWLGAKDATPELLRAAADSNVEVRMAAVLSLMRLGGADTHALESIYEDSKDKVEYSGVNQELMRLIARSRAGTKKR